MVFTQATLQSLPLPASPPPQPVLSALPAHLQSTGSCHQPPNNQENQRLSPLQSFASGDSAARDATEITKKVELQITSSCAWCRQEKRAIERGLRVWVPEEGRQKRAGHLGKPNTLSSTATASPEQSRHPQKQESTGQRIQLQTCPCELEVR